MFHTLRKLVPAQLQEQAVMIRRTFIERVPSERDGQGPCGQRPRYFSDSAVVIGSCSDADALSEACSTGDEDSMAGVTEERCSDSDSSDNEYPPVQHSQDEASSAEDASPQSDGGLSWRRLRTMGFSDCDSDSDFAPSEQTPVTAVAPPAFFASPDVPSCSSAQAVAPPQGWPQLVLGEEMQQQPAQTSEQGLQVWAVLFPAPTGQCSTAAAVAPAASAPTLSLSQMVPAAQEVAPPVRAAAADSEALRGSSTPPGRTTLMVRNVPNNYTRERFLALLDKLGLTGFYDFVYLPVDFKTGATLGYAFVNMVDSSLAQRFWGALDGFNRWSLPSKKRCSLVWNDPHQGLDENVARYRNSPVMHCSVPDSYKPMVFFNGVRVPYPAPTKTIRAPRLPK